MHERPAVPDIVGNPPHLTVAANLRGVRQLRRARRQAEHDRPAGLADRPGNLPDLADLVWVVGDAIDLEEIHAPACVLGQHGVVIGLPGRRVAHAIIAVVPRADVCDIGDVFRMKGRFAATACLGMPRTMWMPNFNPCACTQSASGLKPCPWAAEGKRSSAGTSKPCASMA